MSKINCHDNLAKFKLGVIVYGDNNNLVGHVVGFKLNSTNEVIVDVQWCEGKTFAVHPANLTVWG